MATVTQFVPETLVARTGKSLETRMPDFDAATVLDRVPDWHHSKQFASSLAATLRRFGSLFDNKRFYLHQLAHEQIQREVDEVNAVALRAEAERLRQEAEEEAKYGKEPKNFDAVATCQMPRIAEFLSRGQADRVKGTRLRIDRGPLTVRFQATERNRTRWPGGFLVIGVFGFARDDMPIARIDANGYLYWSDEARFVSDLHAMFEMFENDPVNFVLEHRGKESNCMFCGRDLVDSVSVVMGYGNDCAKMRGLPHDTATAAFWKARRESQMVCEFQSAPVC